MKTTAISTEALAVLSDCEIDGQHVKIISGQLERKLYMEVDEVLRVFGGLWSKKLQVHVFPPGIEIDPLLDEVIRAGVITLPRKNGYFPTPLALADRLVEMAAPEKLGHMCLEPSCGSGNIIHALNRAGVPGRNILGIEISPELATGCAVSAPFQAAILNADFLEDKWTDSCYPEFDRIVMNPPFELRADAIHILRAWEFLAAGGRIVSVAGAGVTFRREAPYVKLRELIEAHGRMADLPAGSFKSSGTMVNTVVITLDKPR